jgi:hypothetical protein
MDPNNAYNRLNAAETFSTKLSVAGGGNLTARRRAVQAQFANAPLIGAPNWAATTVVAAGKRVKHSSGQILYCMTGGTTGGTEPTFNAAQPIADGTAVWWNMSKRYKVNSDGYPVPSISSSTSITGLTAYLLYTNQSLYITPTCPNYIDFGSGAAMQAWLFNDGGIANGQGMGVGLRGYNRVTVFRTDAPKVALGVHNSVGLQFEVYVDGYKLEEDPTPCVTGNPAYYIIDWSAVGGRAMREYRVECSGNNNFKSIAVDSQSVIVPGDLKSATRGIWASDSFGGTVSTYATTTQDYLSERVMKRLGITFARNLHIGGTGYVAGPPTYYAAADVLANNSQLGWDADLCIFGHGYNDQAANVNTLIANAITSWRLMRQQQPRSVIVVLGPWASATGPGANWIAADKALAAQFAAWGDSNSVFISICQDPNGSWTTGTGKTSALTGVGNSDFYIGADGTHPSFNGKVYHEDRIVAAVDAALVAMGR